MRALLAFSLVLATGCANLLGFDDVNPASVTDGGAADAAPGSFALEVLPAKVVRGNSTEVTVRIQRGSEFTDAVTLDFTLPERVTAADALIATNQSEVTVTVAAGPLAELGLAEMVVNGTAGAQVIASPAAPLLIADPPGTLDTTWGGDGVVVIPAQNLANVAPARGLAIAPDGTIVVAGEDELGGAGARDWLFVRLDPADGAEVDRGQRLDLGTLNDIAVQPDGNVLAVGQANFGDTPELVLTRQIGADLGADLTFGTSGRANYSVNGGVGYAVAVGPAGRIVVGGSGGSDGVVARVDTDGDPDPTFGGDGALTGLELNSAPDTDMNAIQAVVVDSMGRVYSAGTPFGTDTLVFRTSPNGTPDTSFTVGGFARLSTAAGGTSEIVYDLALTPGGGVAFTGVSGDNVMVGRFTADGQPDTSFDSDGWRVDDAPLATIEGRAILAQPDGKLVVVGTVRALSDSGFIVRYLDTGALDTDFGVNGRADLGGLQVGEIELELWAVARQADGRILAAGKITGGVDVTPGFVVLRVWD